jgi:hypothetical protein
MGVNPLEAANRNKSLFGSFSSEKEQSLPSPSGNQKNGFVSWPVPRRFSDPVAG